MAENKKSRSLPFKSAEHEAVLKQVLSVSPIKSMMIDGQTPIDGLYSGLTFEAMFFKPYPVLTSPPMSKGVMTADGTFVLGVSHPKFVFTALEKAFGLCYPDEENKRILDWELWKFNTAYYGESLVKEAPSWNTLSTKSSFYRCTGGSLVQPCINVGKECSLQRNELSIALTSLPNPDGLRFMDWTYALRKYQVAQHERDIANKMSNEVENALLKGEKALEKMDIE